MPNKLANVLSSQQVNDAQHLDNMTSLQHFNSAENSLFIQFEVSDDQSALYYTEELEFKSRNHKSWLYGLNT